MSAKLNPERSQAAPAMIAATLTLVFALFAALTWSADAMARGSVAEVNTVASKAQTNPAKALKYWTPKRIREAIPVKAPPPTASPLASAAATSPAGPPGSVAGTLPGSKKVPEVKSGPVPVPMANQVSFRRYEIRKTTAYPNRTHGKVFFRKRGSRYGYVCSATVISSAGRNLLVTAGHCVHGGKGKTWHYNVVFIPGFRNVRREKRPYGAFSASNMITLRGWTGYSDYDYDFALIQLKRNRWGQKVQNAVGSRGAAWGQSRNQFFQSFGYPADKPFYGGRLYRCDSWYAGYGSNNTMGIGCDMTGGSSGGGWVISNEYVNSVNSYGFTYQPRMMYGPYFGSSFSSLYNDYR